MLIDRDKAIKAVNDVTADYVPLLIGRTEEIPLRVASAIYKLPSAESEAYNLGWKEGREALRKEIWEDGRDRLD